MRKGKKLLSLVLAGSMIASTLLGSVMVQADGGEVEEITWMFWDDLDATTDEMSLTFKDTIERFNADYEGKYHVTPITTNLEEYYPALNARVDSGKPEEIPDETVPQAAPSRQTRPTMDHGYEEIIDDQVPQALPVTGQLHWPILMLTIAGMMMLGAAAIIRRRQEGEA